MNIIACYKSQHGLFLLFFFFYQQSILCCISISGIVYYVSITQGQTRSFRTRAVSAFTAHRLISVMQSKHVINGPSQPPLFVVRQTLKSNVSTVGGRNSPGTAEVLMLGISATLRILFFFTFFFLTRHEKNNSFVRIKYLLSKLMFCLIVFSFFLI